MLRSLSVRVVIMVSVIARVGVAIMPDLSHCIGPVKSIKQPDQVVSTMPLDNIDSDNVNNRK
ncbi:MAG: hypothetical protein ISR74_07490 [Candidatus Thioglobus sp.]|nr:hypothetical protein [Candidatus Thioglobus sp.]